MIVNNIKEIEDILHEFKNYNCVVIICKYNGGKSSVITDLIHKHFGEENTYYATFIDQSKPNFKPRESRLKFNEIVKGKIIVFDEIADEKSRDIKSYAKQLIEKNLVIILTNPYGSSNNADKEINLFKEHEKYILSNRTLFVFVKTKLKAKVIESLKENKLTIREAAELLNVEYWEMQQIMDEEGVNLIDISEEEIAKRQKNDY